MATNKKSEATAETAAVEGKLRDYNRVEIGGRLVEDAELRYISMGKAVCKLRVATNDSKTAQFHDVVAWEALAETAGTLSKGTFVEVAGRIQTRSWKATDGSSRRAIEIVASALTPRATPAE